MRAGASGPRSRPPAASDTLTIATQRPARPDGRVNGDQGRHILIAVARYLAAHFPTERALLQTADIARRLMRGGELHREAQAAE